MEELKKTVTLSRPKCKGGLSHKITQENRRSGGRTHSQKDAGWRTPASGRRTSGTAIQKHKHRAIQGCLCFRIDVPLDRAKRGPASP